MNGLEVLLVDHEDVCGQVSTSGRNAVVRLP
jgi:hypothetical protein